MLIRLLFVLVYVGFVILLESLSLKSTASKSHESFVYLLESTQGRTYVGATVNLTRRLRQHNREISGGARATALKKSSNESWKYVCHVCGFPDWRAALQFEWSWKHQRLVNLGKTKALEKRKIALMQLLSKEKSTSSSIPFASYPNNLTIVWSNNHSCKTIMS